MSVPADDRGLLLGDGLFETVLAVDGRLVDFGAHARRLATGCGVLDLPPPEMVDLRRAAEQAIEAAGLMQHRAAVRLTWTAGSGGRGLDRPDPPRPRLVATAHPLGQPPPPPRLVTSSVRRNADSPATRVKSLAYLDNVLARREARAAGADDALMLNTRGEAACASAANLFWFEGDGLRTPARDCGVLEGTMRARVLAAAAALGLDIAEVRAPAEALVGVRGLFLTNSLVGLLEAVELDGRPIEACALVGRLRAAVEAREP